MKKRSMLALNRLSADDFKEAEKRPLVVVLDNVRSMHNVGAVFRTADAFALEKIWLCGITPTPPQREIHKTALGAEETVAWEHAPDVVALLHQLRAEAYCLVAVEQADESLLLPAFTPAPDQKYAIILGHEVEGVSDAALDVVDMALEIPQFGTKHSLNVSVAAGIVLYHFTAQLKGEL
jgi:23S rRNA (guanosine2251-2'-O)-methyltransferase